MVRSTPRVFRGIPSPARPYPLVSFAPLKRTHPFRLSSPFTETLEQKKKTTREPREMASGLVLTSIRPAVIRASAAEGRGRRKGPAKSVAGGGGGNNWWVPLFGWSAEPDYIDGAGAGAGPAEDSPKKGATASAGEEERRRPAGRRFAAFTEEKARELRMRSMETEAFHDVMYHSAIASRLASDLPRRPLSADN
ncbi:unnamed protein product [Musa hybrid cultivar]